MEKQQTIAPSVFLTFDDGPSFPATAQILDILWFWQIKASFFVCGKNVERYPNLARRIVREGHLIANHSYSHRRFLGLTGLLGKEIAVTQRLIKMATGIETKFFRPPWGYAVPWLRYDLKRKNYTLVLWDAKAYDWLQFSASAIAARILKKIKPGTIILLHDGDRAQPCANRSHTVAALPLILRALQKQGYCFLRLDAGVQPQKKPSAC